MGIGNWELGIGNWELGAGKTTVNIIHFPVPCSLLRSSLLQTMRVFITQMETLYR
ncbi:MAG: hypothetical protein F6K47_10965 [Symploca sp. SIO2E6]|nr:hypothetical protein [Symploca sp. SIO2E6]